MNLLGHNFLEILVTQARGTAYFKCSKCNHVIFRENSYEPFTYANSKMSRIKDSKKLSITCDEMIIKNLLE